MAEILQLPERHALSHAERVTFRRVAAWFRMLSKLPPEERDALRKGMATVFARYEALERARGLLGPPPWELVAERLEREQLELARRAGGPKREGP